MKRFIIPLFLLSAVLFVNPFNTQAQSLKLPDLASVVGTATSHLSGFDITGTWSYTGSAVSFESDSFLKKAGGKVASSAVEKQLDEQLEGLGFLPGLTTITFNDDDTFTQSASGKNFRGNYSYDKNSGTVTLKYLNLVPLKAHITGNSRNMDLLFSSDGFLSMITFIGSSSGVSLLQGVSSILGGYDGMMTGLSFQKK